MQNLNSDQLRRQLDENNAAMNTLADDNQRIVELLAQRGLKAIEKAAGEDLVFSADKMILTNADGAEVFNTDRPNLFADPDLRADSRVKSPFSEEHSKAVNQPIPEELSAIMSSFFKGFGHVRVGNTGGEVLIDTEWPNPLVNPDQYEAHRRMAEWVDTFQGAKEDRVPLTADELKAGGWWCGEDSHAVVALLICIGVKIFDEGQVSRSTSEPFCLFMANMPAVHVQRFPLGRINQIALKEIHRRGNNFYWGAPGDQEN